MQYEPALLDDSPASILYQKYAPGVFAYLYKQTASREDAEDLLVEVFLAVLEHRRLSSMSEDEQKAWIWRVARNKVVDHYRRFSRHPKVPLNEVTESILEDEGRGPEQAFLRQEEYARLHAAMRELPGAQQEILRLRFGHGLNCIEIAHILEKNVGAVRMLLSRTLKRLRTVYTQH